MKTRVLTAHVPQDLAIKIDEAAAKIDRSRNWIIKQALLLWLERGTENTPSKAEPEDSIRK